MTHAFSYRIQFCTSPLSVQVDFLLRLLVDIFPLQERNGTLRVVAYHKSVLDWLTNPTRSTDLFVDSGRGNQHAGMACFNAVKGAGVSLTGPPPSRETTLEEDVCLGPLVQRPGSILLYSLRFGLAHLCLAHSYSGCLESLEALILDFCGFWPMVFKQGAPLVLCVPNNKEPFQCAHLVM